MIKWIEVRKMKKWIAVLMVLALTLISCAYAENIETAAADEAVACPEYSAIAIALGDTLQMELAEAQAEGAVTQWASSDETVASVDANGLISALNAGEATITASVTKTIVETVEKTIVETVEETDSESGEIISKEVEKIVPEDVEKEITEEITFDVAIEAAVCPGCAAEYANAEEFAAHVQIAACGAEGHYACDGQDHETQLDEFCRNENPHRVCQAGVATHECESCGKTYACEDSGSHATCIACGNAWCDKDEGDHATPNCGKVAHRPCMLKHFNKNDHRRCRHCGELRCNGGAHGEGKCVPAADH